MSLIRRTLFPVRKTHKPTLASALFRMRFEMPGTRSIIQLMTGFMEFAYSFSAVFFVKYGVFSVDPPLISN